MAATFTFCPRRFREMIDLVQEALMLMTFVKEHNLRVLWSEHCVGAVPADLRELARNCRNEQFADSVTAVTLSSDTYYAWRELARIHEGDMVSVRRRVLAGIESGRHDIDAIRESTQRLGLDLGIDFGTAACAGTAAA